jgi:hypothetical protein
MTPRILLIALFIVGLVVVTYVLALSNKTEGPEFKKVEEIQMIKPQKPVAIKLRRTQSGSYTWEVRGNDVEKIIKADNELRSLIKENE